MFGRVVHFFRIKHKGAPFLALFARSGAFRGATTPLQAMCFPPFAKNAKDGAPTSCLIHNEDAPLEDHTKPYFGGATVCLSEFSTQRRHSSLRSCARRFKVRIWPVRQHDWDNLAVVGVVRIVAAVHRGVGQKRPKNTALIVHHQIGVLPMTAQLDIGAMVPRKMWREPGPVVHIEIDGLSVSREIQMWPHGRVVYFFRIKHMGAPFLALFTRSGAIRKRRKLNPEDRVHFVL